MPRVQFSGYILPAFHKLTIDPLPSTQSAIPDLGITLTCQPKILENNVTVDCDCNLFDPAEHLSAVFSRALEIVRVPVDLFAFANGVGLSVVLDRLTEENGKSGPVLMVDDALGRTATAVNNLSPDQFSSIITFASRNPGFYLTLRDLIEILTEPYVAPRNGHRVVEGIRHLLSHGEQDKIKSWRKLQTTLQIERSYLDIIGTSSRASRHGEKTSAVTGQMSKEITYRVWAVMNRYIEFRKRGAVLPLPLSEFPLLT